MRSGSLIAAAEKLGITPAAVGQRVKAIEDYLGVELLLRGRGGLRPSPALAAALPHLIEAFAELDRAAEALDLQRGTELHVSGPSDFIDLWLQPRLDDFRLRYPQVLFSLNGEGDAPLRIGRTDCRIEFAPARSAETGTDILFGDYVLPLGSPANIVRTAALPPATRLEGFPLLHVDFYKDDPAGISWVRWIGANGLNRDAPERGIRFQRIRAALDSVLADAGLALCGIALAREQVEAGAIGFAYPVDMGLKTQHRFQAVYRQDGLQRSAIRAFREWLTSEAEKTRLWLDGFPGGGAA